MRHRIVYSFPFAASFCYVLVLFNSSHQNDANRATRVTNDDSRTLFFVDGFAVPNRHTNLLQIGWFPYRNMNHLSQKRTAEMVSPKLNRGLPRRNDAVAMTTTQLKMCICINCARVVDCSAYYFVETKHEQPHIAAQPTFTPRDGSPTIHVNIRTTDRSSSKATKSTTDSTNDDQDVSHRIWSEATKRTRAEKNSAESDTDGGDDVVPKFADETGETVIPMSTTYTEYDVVACADYVEDMNCWIRNMPDEIKRANPNFVPT